jgi:CheY-like chemotaxis protein
MKNRHCIVVVEDCCDEREALRLTLEIEGYDVVAVAGAEEALNYMRSTTPSPSMILLDLMMHGTNGWEFRTEQLTRFSNGCDPGRGLLGRWPAHRKSRCAGHN